MTNSPPLEATGNQSQNPMGASSVNAAAEGKGKVEGVPDSEQRKEYFDTEKKDVEEKAKESAKPRMMGESLAQKHEKLD